MERITDYIVRYAAFLLAIVPISLILLIVIYLNSEIDNSKLGGPESFGQFGDYLGGVLNPIFGFITVCLLIGTASLSKKQANDSSAQLKLNKDEYNRKQMEDVLRSLFKSHELLFGKNFESVININNTFFEGNLKLLSSKEAKNNTGICKSLRAQIDNDTASPEVKIVYEKLRINIIQINEIVYDLLKLTHVDVIKNYWASEIRMRTEECRFLEILSEVESEELSQKIRTALQ